MKLKTGFGYYVTTDGRKTHKFELPIGEHPEPLGHTFVEVESKEALDQIKLDKSDQTIALEKEDAEHKKHLDSATKKLQSLGLTDAEIKAILR